MREYFEGYGTLYIPEPIPDDANLGGVEYLKYVIESGQWLENYGITPNGGGYDHQSRKWTKVFRLYLQQRQYAEYQGLSAEEKQRYKPRPEKRGADDVLGEY